MREPSIAASPLTSLDRSLTSLDFSPPPPFLDLLHLFLLRHTAAAAATTTAGRAPRETEELGEKVALIVGCAIAGWFESVAAKPPTETGSRW
jgi:hypothetical protein